MSIAAGRGWMAAGQGLNNIGALLLQNQEMERERQRQAEADKVAARNQAMREAAFTQETGLTPFGTPAPQTGVYSGGEYVSVTGKQLAPMSATAPSATSNLPSIGFGAVPGVSLTPPTSAAPVAPKMAAPAIAAMVTGGQIPTPRSAAQRADDEKLKRASMAASALSANNSAGTPLNPAFAGLPWREQLNTVQNPTAMSAIDQRQRQDELAATRQGTEREEANSAARYRQRFGPQSGSRYRITPGLSDKETITEGLRLAGLDEADTQRRARGGNGTGGGAARARQLIPAAQGQVRETRTQLTQAQRNLPWDRTGTVARSVAGGADRDAAGAAFTRDSTLAAGEITGLRGRLREQQGTADSLMTAATGGGTATTRPGVGATQAQARARAQELQGQGLTRTQILARLQADGYNVQP